MPPISETPAMATGTKSNFRALAIVTTLFFMWGFITVLNDILVPHLKSIFDLSYTEVMLVQFSFFSAYLVFSMPSGIVGGVARLQEHHGDRFVHHGGGSVSIHWSGDRGFVSFVFNGVDYSCGGHYSCLQVSANPRMWRSLGQRRQRPAG